MQRTCGVERISHDSQQILLPEVPSEKAAGYVRRFGFREFGDAARLSIVPDAGHVEIASLCFKACAIDEKVIVRNGAQESVDEEGEW